MKNIKAIRMKKHLSVGILVAAYVVVLVYLSTFLA